MKAASFGSVKPQILIWVIIPPLYLDPSSRKQCVQEQSPKVCGVNGFPFFILSEILCNLKQISETPIAPSH